MQAELRINETKASDAGPYRWLFLQKHRYRKVILTRIVLHSIVLLCLNFSTSFSRCRVDFWKAATRNYKIFLGLAKEPNVRILDSAGREVSIAYRYIMDMKQSSEISFFPFFWHEIPESLLLKVK